MRQDGMVLVMALVFLVLLTILGVTALSTTSLEEKMAGNLKDKTLAFQAAEAAVSVAEDWINRQTTKPNFPDQSNGLYVPSTTDTANWDSITWSSNSNLVVYPNTPTETRTGTLGKVNNQPKYIIEDLGEVPEAGGSKVVPTNYKNKGNTMLRVTTRGTGGTDAAQVMLQTTYSKPFN
jgi:type IV pilus assembly protein PilX